MPSSGSQVAAEARDISLQAYAGAVRLFDDIERRDNSPSAYSEDTFTFLNRVEGPVWQRIRDTLEAWFSDYPIEHAADLSGRFRERRPGAHTSAFFELYLHHLF